MPHAPHAAQAHSRVLLDQQLVPDLHYQAVKVLALKGQGQVGRAPGGGGTGKASPGFPLLTVGPGAEKLQLSVPATHVTPPNTTPGALKGSPCPAAQHWPGQRVPREGSPCARDACGQEGAPGVTLATWTMVLLSSSISSSLSRTLSKSSYVQSSNRRRGTGGRRTDHDPPGLARPRRALGLQSRMTTTSSRGGHPGATWPGERGAWAALGMQTLALSSLHPPSPGASRPWLIQLLVARLSLDLPPPAPREMNCRSSPSPGPLPRPQRTWQRGPPSPAMSSRMGRAG